MPTRLIDGLSVEVQGTGQPILLLHGNGESRQIFDPLVPYLRPGRRVIAADTRGHGHSVRGGGPLSMARLAADAARIIGDVAGEPVDLVGFSDGGNIALTLAGQRPDLVRSLVVMGANTQPRGLRTRTLLGVLADYAAARFAGIACADMAARAEIIGLMVHEPHLTAAALQHIHAPTLVLVGDRDVIRRSDTDRIVREVAHTRMVTVLGSGHNIIGVKPGVVATAINEFLADVGRQRPAEGGVG